MIGAVIAGCCITKPMARWMSDVPASSASSANCSTASSLAAFSGLLVSYALGRTSSDGCPGVSLTLRDFPLSQPPASGLHGMTPMWYCSATGSTSASMPRTSSECADCSVTIRPRPRRSEIHWSSTVRCAGNVDEPKARILPWRWRSVSAAIVSPSLVSGRWTWWTSIQSVWSRCRLFPTSCTIQRRELLRLFGSPVWPIDTSIGSRNFVARMTSSRRPPARALPTMTSDSPGVDVGGVDEVDAFVEGGNASGACRRQNCVSTTEQGGRRADVGETPADPC